MKFCKRKRNSYISCGKVCSTDYILSEDVLAFHGKVFFERWNEFMKSAKTVHIKDVKSKKDLVGYYYADYEHYARMTDFYLNPTS
jgi:hypothetical protein